MKTLRNVFHFPSGHIFVNPLSFHVCVSQNPGNSRSWFSEPVDAQTEACLH